MDFKPMDFRMIGWMAGMAVVVLGICWTLVVWSSKRTLKKLDDAPTTEQVKAMIEIASLTMESKVSKEIAQTRHDIRNELQSSTLSLNAKLDATQTTMSAVQSSLARIEGQISTLPKRRMDHME